MVLFRGRCLPQNCAVICTTSGPRAHIPQVPASPQMQHGVSPARLTGMTVMDQMP